ncbi:hypothetical protein HA402_008875, partial [Bradysia odoriphaga]
DSPLSSKVAMFNKTVREHTDSQMLNPFSQDGRSVSPKPKFSKEEYGKPIAGSLTAARGQKANMHVFKEMLELCQIINTEGYPQSEEDPSLKFILFGELFNIYTHINDKLVGLLLRARKHKLLDFEGEVLFQRRDDDVPVCMCKPIKEIKAILDGKVDEVRRSVSPNPHPTTMLIK